MTETDSVASTYTKRSHGSNSTHTSGTAPTTHTSLFSNNSSGRLPLFMSPTISVPSSSGIPPPPDSHHRAVHEISLSALTHNYSCVESAASQQQCCVISVVKADGYGHGAVATALHLADSCGADAFAVATLEEAIVLRRAFVATRKTLNRNNTPDVLPVPPTYSSSSGDESPFYSSISKQQQRSRRPPHIRILVLGPPVGFPRCFDDYLYHNIECMVSGPEVACSLIEWVSNADERKRTLVERAARDAKEQALVDVHAPKAIRQDSNEDDKEQLCDDDMDHNNHNNNRQSAATLSNVSGQDLAKEVRAILMSQQQTAVAAAAAASASKSNSRTPSGRTTPAANMSRSASVVSHNNPQGDTSTTTTTNSNGTLHHPPETTTTNKNTATSSNHPTKPRVVTEVFGGIEAAAKQSRNREMAHQKAVFVEQDFEEEEDEKKDATHIPKTDKLATNARTMATNVLQKRKLRWHALVDSGMGRLGFKTQPVEAGDKTGRRDTVAILKEMVDLEVHQDAPIEFYGMVTHMAEATEGSDYTKSQIGRFKQLLKRVRGAGISIPTVSTDNSAALLTTTLTHFTPDELLSQPHSNTRGFVRTGGAIYGQRPAFAQLRPVSTLKASVRHVAVLKQGESVGYDRAYIAPMDVRIATLTIGFADGYPRELGNGVGKVSIRHNLFPVAGNVCMDMLMVELGPAEDVDGAGAQVVVGDVAVLWGPESEEDQESSVRLQDLAASLKTTQSALTCGLDKIRVRREYVP